MNGGTLTDMSAIIPASTMMLGTPTATALVRSEEHQKNRAPNPAELAEMVASGQIRMDELLPTPKAWDSSGGGSKVTGRTVTRPSGVTFSTNLRDLAYSGLLPTPHNALYKTSTLTPEAWEKRIADKRQEDLNMAIYRKTGRTSQLSPLFVEEMMGFPKGYTVSPFLDGAKNP
jgi:hypothetical protein